MSGVFSPDQADIFENILRARRDVRGHLFTEKPVSDTQISRIIDAGLTAPSVGFSQPWRFVVIRDENVKNEVKDTFLSANKRASEEFKGARQKAYQALKLDGILEAPVNIAVYYVPETKPVLGQNSMAEMGEYSVVCAIQNMWLMARALNIGMGWVSILEPEKVSKILNAPKGAKLIGYLCFGYVCEFQDQPELEARGWEKRKHKESLVFKDSF